MNHGADGLSIISAISKSSNIQETVQQFYKLLNNAENFFLFSTFL